MTVFAHPIDVHYTLKGIDGWPRLQLEVWGVEESAMNKFQALLESGIGAEKMKKGDSMTLEWGGGGKAVEVTVRGKKVGKIADASLAKGLLRLYLDEKNTVSPALIKDIGSS